MSYQFHWMHRNNWPNTKKGLREMFVFLENRGIASVLLPYGPHGTDFLLHLSDIFEHTTKIRVMIALPAYGISPEYAMKTFTTAQRWGKNRLDLNLISGNYRGEVEQQVISNYPWNIDMIDSHEKRVSLTESWMEKFHQLLDEHKRLGIEDQFKTTLYVVGASDTTIRTANKYADYIIVNDLMLNKETLSKITNAKLLFVIDPLILDEGQDINSVEYHEYAFTKHEKHPIKGTHEEVVKQIKSIAEEFNIDEFLVHTDQKDLTKIWKLIEELSNS